MQQSEKIATEVSCKYCGQIAAAAGVRSGIPVVRSSIFAAAIFVAANLALMIGLTTLKRFVFDEVRYVPAARQMPGQAMPMLNPIASAAGAATDRASIRFFGGGPFA
jgi:hypothetical protein